MEKTRQLKDATKKVFPSSSDGALKKRKFEHITEMKRSTTTSFDSDYDKKTTKLSSSCNEHSSLSFDLRRPQPSSRSSSPTLTSRSRSSLLDSSSSQNEQFDTVSYIKPSTYMMSTLHAQGYYVRSRPSLSMPDSFFTTIINNNDTSSSYGQDITNAIRARDINTLRKMWKVDGRSLQCCNRYGESILHMSCRLGFTDVVEFLLDEVKVPIHVIDDCGRTPLHDSLWTCTPNFDLVDMIIDRAPELLFLSDKRGLLPLDYVRKNHYEKCIEYIDKKNSDSLIPKSSKMKSLFVMEVNAVQANKVNSLIQKNYLDVILRSNKASSVLSLSSQLLQQQQSETTTTTTAGIYNPFAKKQKQILKH